MLGITFFSLLPISILFMNCGRESCSEKREKNTKFCKQFCYFCKFAPTTNQCRKYTHQHLAFVPFCSIKRTILLLFIEHIHFFRCYCCVEQNKRPITIALKSIMWLCEFFLLPFCHETTQCADSIFFSLFVLIKLNLITFVWRKMLVSTCQALKSHTQIDQTICCAGVSECECFVLQRRRQWMTYTLHKVKNMQ